MPKRKLLLTIYLGLFFYANSNAQELVFDYLKSATVEIKYNRGGNSTGVMFGDSSYYYLVTARHCLINTDQRIPSLVDSIITLLYYAKDPFSDTAESMKINLAAAARLGYLLFDSIQDIAVLAIAKVTGYTQSHNPRITYFPIIINKTKFSPAVIGENIDIDFDHIYVNNDCFIMGFPSSLGLSSIRDYDFDRPLVRKGVIAGKDKQKRTVIIDCPSYQGNSGGPAYYLPSITGTKKTGLLGIVSRSILQVESLESSYYRTTVSVNYSNSGYTVVVPIEFAMNLMNRFMKQESNRGAK